MLDKSFNHDTLLASPRNTGFQMKTLCIVRLFLNPRLYLIPSDGVVDVEMYLNLDKSIEDQVFDTFGDKIADFTWQEKNPSIDLTTLVQ